MLTAGDDQVGLEILDEDADDLALQKGRRSMGSMSSMSGANGKVYMEYKYDNYFSCLDRILIRNDVLHGLLYLHT